MERVGRLLYDTSSGELRDGSNEVMQLPLLKRASLVSKLRKLVAKCADKVRPGTRAVRPALTPLRLCAPRLARPCARDSPRPWPTLGSPFGWVQ